MLEFPASPAALALFFFGPGTAILTACTTLTSPGSKSLPAYRPRSCEICLRATVRFTGVSGAP